MTWRQLRSPSRPLRFRARGGTWPLLLEALEGRCLPSLGVPSPGLIPGIAEQFDAPWRGYDTGVYTRSGPGSLAIADMDGDGDADAVVGRSHFGGPGVSVLMNFGDGTFDLPVHYDLPLFQMVGDVAVADIDRDGDPDVLATMPDANYQSSLLALYRNQGNGILAPRVQFATGRAPLGLVAADFTGAGDERGVRRHAGDDAPADGGLDLLEVRGVDEQPHVTLPCSVIGVCSASYTSRARISRRRSSPLIRAAASGSSLWAAPTA